MKIQQYSQFSQTAIIVYLHFAVNKAHHITYFLLCSHNNTYFIRMKKHSLLIMISLTFYKDDNEFWHLSLDQIFHNLCPFVCKIFKDEHKDYSLINSSFNTHMCMGIHIHTHKTFLCQMSRTRGYAACIIANSM